MQGLLTDRMGEHHGRKEGGYACSARKNEAGVEACLVGVAAMYAVYGQNRRR